MFSQSEYQTIETLDPQTPKFVPGIPHWGEEMADVGACVCCGRGQGANTEHLPSRRSLLKTSRQLGASCGPHLGLDCSGISPCLVLTLTSEPRRWKRGTGLSFFQCASVEQISYFWTLLSSVLPDCLKTVAKPGFLTVTPSFVTRLLILAVVLITRLPCMQPGTVDLSCQLDTPGNGDLQLKNQLYQNGL